MVELSQNLQLKQTQELRLNQKQIQSLRILQLQKTELNQMIEMELEKNPVLEVEENDTNTILESLQEQEKESISEETPVDKIDYEWSRENEENGYLPMPKYKNSSEEETNFEKFISKKENLSEYLIKQISLTNADEKQKRIAEFLIGNIDSKGFLAISLEEAARFLNCDPNDVEDVLFLLQEIAPTGVAARDLRECLILQFYEKNMTDEIVYRIIDDFLDELGNNKIKYIAHIMGVGIEEIKRAVNIIRNEFSPRPAIDDFITEDNLYIPDPDVIVTEDEEGNLRVELNERGAPRLRRSPYYTKMLNKSKNMDKNTRKYLVERAKAAEEFINSIDKRKNTILEIAKLIVNRQEEFFKKGIRYLKSFTIKEVATELQLHESTISRAVNGKYMISPCGMFELRFFFTSGYSVGKVSDTSRESIKDLIREIIEKEDKKKPLSDQTIAERLKGKGLSLARRTVTKYREELGILAASKRKVF